MIKKVFNKIMLFIFITSLALFIVLGIWCIIIGPKNTENSLKSLLNFDNYLKKYKELIPLSHNNVERDYESAENILGVETKFGKLSDFPPFIVPTSGIAPSVNFLFTGPLDQGKHEGIDIWTNINGTGMDGQTYGKGNPVYASCSGYVRNIWEENGDVSIVCDPIDPIFKNKLPSLEVKTLYGHMADQFSSEVYIYVSVGQRVTKGEFIGYQGNRCYYAPQNRVVHLHFGIYDISDGKHVPLDPEPYIGVSCTTLNQVFTTQIE